MPMRLSISWRARWTVKAAITAAEAGVEDVIVLEAGDDLGLVAETSGELLVVDEDVRTLPRHHLGQGRNSIQLDLAARHGCSGHLLSRGERLLADLDVFFDDYSPEASLLHGDLWSGNYAYTSEGEPAIFDPAVYYGDREADIAMTELFGGFGAAFHAAYENAWPLDPGYRTRKTLYNLYHILNHLNLFGRSYLGRSVSLLRELAEVV